MKTELLLVDDHKIMRDGIRAILKHSNEYQVIAEAESGTEAVRICKALSISLVIIDLNLPGLSGVDAIVEILRHRPETKIIVLSMNDDEASVVNALRAGARGFVLKSGSDSDLLSALRAVASGGSYLSPKVSSQLLRRVQRGKCEESTSPLHRLNSRDVQILRLVAEGNTSKDIANLLNLQLTTVRSYRKSLMRKLGVSNVAGLTQVALRAGITRI
ncbi:MAG: response regulator [Bryobacteraceae bacterium]